MLVTFLNIGYKTHFWPINRQVLVCSGCRDRDSASLVNSGRAIPHLARNYDFLDGFLSACGSASFDQSWSHYTTSGAEQPQALSRQRALGFL
jgi:hypothetical protein